MGISKFNKNQTTKFINNEKFETFYTLEELYRNELKDVQELGTVINGKRCYKITGVYSFKSSYGEGCFIKSTGFNISLPLHLNSTMNELRNDVESVNDINEGIAYIEIYPYRIEQYGNKEFYSINFIEHR